MSNPLMPGGSNIPPTSTNITETSAKTMESSAKNDKVAFVDIDYGQGRQILYEVKASNQKLSITPGISGSSKFEIFVPSGVDASDLLKDTELLKTIIKTSVQKIEKPRFFEKDYNFTIQKEVNTEHIHLLAEARDRGILGFFKELFSIEPKVKNYDITEKTIKSPVSIIKSKFSELRKVYDNFNQLKMTQVEYKDDLKKSSMENAWLTPSINTFLDVLKDMYKGKESYFNDEFKKGISECPELYRDVFLEMVSRKEELHEMPLNVLSGIYSTQRYEGGEPPEVTQQKNKIADLLVKMFAKDPDRSTELLLGLFKNINIGGNLLFRIYSNDKFPAIPFLKKMGGDPNYINDKKTCGSIYHDLLLETLRVRLIDTSDTAPASRESEMLQAMTEESFTESERREALKCIFNVVNNLLGTVDKVSGSKSLNELFDLIKFIVNLPDGHQQYEKKYMYLNKDEIQTEKNKILDKLYQSADQFLAMSEKAPDKSAGLFLAMFAKNSTKTADLLSKMFVKDSTKFADLFVEIYKKTPTEFAQMLLVLHQSLVDGFKF